MAPLLTLRPLARADFALLARWLRQPHVARWWDHETSPEAIARDFGPSIDGDDRAEIFIASIADSQDERPGDPWPAGLTLGGLVGSVPDRPVGLVPGSPVGLVQRYTFADNPDYLTELAPLLAVPGAALSMDYFIGETAALQRGLGSRMLQTALQSTWPAYPRAPAVIVPVVVANTASWKLLERVGFQRVASGPLTPDNPVDDPAHFVYRIARPR